MLDNIKHCVAIGGAAVPAVAAADTGRAGCPIVIVAVDVTTEVEFVPPPAFSALAAYSGIWNPVPTAHIMYKICGNTEL